MELLKLSWVLFELEEIVGDWMRFVMLPKAKSINDKPHIWIRSSTNSIISIPAMEIVWKGLGLEF